MQKIIKEPLVQFLLIGGALFFLYSFLNPSTEGVDNNLISIDDSDVKRLIKSYEKTWNAPPDSTTLSNLVSEEIKSEVFYREAIRMQLDHNDEIIRRRLKQKYEFLVKDLANNLQPSEADLSDYYEEHTDQYLEPVKLSFSQIYFSPDKRKNPFEDAQRILIQIIKSNKTNVDVKSHGDPFHLQSHFDSRDHSDVRQVFGKEFADAIFKQKIEGWTGPIRSGYGIHLVNLTTIKDQVNLSYADIKERVIADWKTDQQQSYNEQLYENLLRGYEVEYDFEKRGE